MHHNPKGYSSVKGGAEIDIHWKDRRLGKICADDRSGQRHFGADEWRVVRRRLGSLHAAPTLADLEGVPGRCHALGGDRIGQFAMSLWGPYRLVFAPARTSTNLPDGGIDRHSVTAIEIVEVTNYHDD